jgi:hypothetical protein
MAAGALSAEELVNRHAKQAEWEGQGQEVAGAFKLFAEGCAATEPVRRTAAAPAGAFAALLSGSRRQAAQAASRGRGGRGRGSGGSSSARGSRQQQLSFNEYMELIAAVRV